MLKMLISSILLMITLSPTLHAGEYITDLDDLKFGDKISIQAANTGQWLGNFGNMLYTSSTSRITYTLNPLNETYNDDSVYGKYGYITQTSTGRNITQDTKNKVPKMKTISHASNNASRYYQSITFNPAEGKSDGQFKIMFKSINAFLTVMPKDKDATEKTSTFKIYKY